MKYAHHRDVFDVIYDDYPKKLSDLSQGRVTYSCSEVLGGPQTGLSPTSPTSTRKDKRCFHLTATRRKVSFFHATFTTMSLLSLKQISVLLQLSPSKGVAVSTGSRLTLQQVWQRAPQALHSRQPPCRGHADFAPLEFNGGVEGRFCLQSRVCTKKVWNKLLCMYN